MDGMLGEGPLSLINTAFFFPYQLMMLYGIVTLASCWAWTATAPRRVNDALLLAFGLVIPVCAWILTLFVPVFFFLMPLSLGFLYLKISSEEAVHLEAEDSLHREDLEHAQRQLEADDKNAAAHWAKAQVYERRGENAKALESYERAHELDQRTIPVAEMEDIRARIGHRLDEERAGDSPAGRLARLVGSVRLEGVFFAVGLAYLLWNSVFAVNLMSLMLFLRWFRGGRA